VVTTPAAAVTAAGFPLQGFFDCWVSKPQGEVEEKGSTDEGQSGELGDGEWERGASHMDGRRPPWRRAADELGVRLVGLARLASPLPKIQEQNLMKKMMEMGK